MKFHFPQIHVPEIHVPQIHVPKINLPHIPKVNLPQIHVPKVNLPQIHVPSLKPLPKPHIDMPALQKATGYIADAISIIPIVRPIMTGIKVGLNVATHGESGKYLNDNQKTNKSWDMAPGGALFQRSLNDITKGRSGTWIDSHTIDPVKIVTQQINHLPPKYHPTQIIHHSEGNGSSTLFRHTVSTRNIIKPPLFQTTNNILYSPPSTIQVKNPVVRNSGYIIPKPNVLPIYKPVFNEKIPVRQEPIVQIKEPVSTLSLSNQPQLLIPKTDNKFNQLQTNNVIIEPIKSNKVDMTIPFISITGILLLLFIRR